jgi:hypothetical protein
MFCPGSRVANDVSDDQCPKMNVKPTETDFYALMTPVQAQKVAG